MKVCFIVQTFDKRDRGGVLRVVAQLSNFFINHHDVTIMSCGNVETLAYDIDYRINIISLGMISYNTGFYKSFRKLNWFNETYSKIQPFLKDDVIWITSSPPLSLLFSVLKLKNSNIKVIGCDHTSTVYRKNFFIQKFRNKLLSKLDVMVGLNHQDVEYYKKNGIKSVWIPNGIDLQEKYSEKSERKYLIYVGRFNEEKQPFHAINLFVNSILPSQGVKMKMFGHGEYEKEVADYILKNNYQDMIEIVKGETDPDVIYKDAYALILTSKLEGFPLVLLEAISRNIPCLSFKIPYGPINIIKNGINGFFVENSNDSFNKGVVGLNDINRELVHETIVDYDIKNIVKKWNSLIKNFEEYYEKV